MLLGVEKLTVEEALAAPAGDRTEKTWSPTYEVDVDRELARFGSWYELFPRSWGGFDGVRAVLPQLAALGFDVVYLPPVQPDRPLEPQGAQQRARGGAEGSGQPVGDRLRGGRARRDQPGARHARRSSSSSSRAAKKHRIEIALDFAIQCSPDHPWLKEHPEWFNRRPDGTLKYAENPPKRYQDIYNVNFDSEDWQGLWEALRDVVLTWVERGVTRVPRRQPAHEAGGVLGVADRRGATRPSRGDLPRGGVHAAPR